MKKFKYFVTAFAAISMPVMAIPAVSQDGVEEARTTYQVSFLRFANDAGTRWDELMQKYIIPARVAAGQPVPQIHWIQAGEWDIMVVREMRGGLSTLDVHDKPEDAAFDAAMLKLAGSQEALDAIYKEFGTLTTARARTFTHTHP